MNKYELTIIIDGEATPAKKKAVAKKIEDLIKVFKGKLIKSVDWGKLDLAYKLNKKGTGTFLFNDIELDGQMASKLSQKLEQETDIIRVLLVRAEK